VRRRARHRSPAAGRRRSRHADAPAARRPRPRVRPRGRGVPRAPAHDARAAPPVLVVGRVVPRVPVEVVVDRPGRAARAAPGAALVARVRGRRAARRRAWRQSATARARGRRARRRPRRAGGQLPTVGASHRADPGVPVTDASDLTVALLPWGDVIEDYLDELDMTVDGFLDEMSGGWMFGYVDALASARVRTVLAIVSRAVTRPERRVHRATGATAWLLPSPRAYRAVRSRLASSWAADRFEASGGRRGVATIAPEVARNLAPWCSTPVRALARVVRDERCDALLVQEYEEARFDVCVALGRVLRRPVFATFQGGSVARTRFERFTRPLAIGRCAGLVVASSDEIRRLHDERGVPDDRIAGIVNPIDVDRWRPEPKDTARRELGIGPDARVVAWHGRVDLTRKGLDTLVAAWREVLDRHRPAPPRLRLVGSGRDAVALHALLDDLGDGAETVTWRDEYVNDRAVVRRELSAADVYVLPSR